MSDTPDNLIPGHLRHIRARVDDVASDMVEVKERLGLLEGSVASLSRRTDRLAGDVERIKRRPDLTETQA